MCVILMFRPDISIKFFIKNIIFGQRNYKSTKYPIKCFIKSVENRKTSTTLFLYCLFVLLFCKSVPRFFCFMFVRCNCDPGYGGKSCELQVDDRQEQEHEEGVSTEHNIKLNIDLDSRYRPFHNS